MRRCPETTPDPLHLQKVLAGVKDRGATHAVVELSLQSLIRDEWVQGREGRVGIMEGALLDAGHL